MALETKERVTPEGQATDDAFARIMDSPDNADLRENLNAAEQNPDTGSGGTNENPFGYAKEDEEPRDHSNSRWGKAANWALDRRKKIAFALAGAGVLVGMVMSLFTLTIAPIAFLEEIMPDLDTSVGSLVMAHNSLLMSKLLYSSEAVSDCKLMSIRCKFSTMSKEQVARYERAGFKVTGDKTKLLGRIRPTSIEFQGESYTPKEFLEAKAKNPTLRNAETRANNMRYLSTATGRFMDAVLTRFGITKQKPGLSGSKTDRINQLLSAAGKSSMSDVSFTEIKNDKGETTGYTVDGDDTGKVYKPEEYDKLQKTVAAGLKERPVMSKIRGVQSSPGFTGLARTVSLTGYADLGCTLYNMVGATAVAAKINTVDALVKFAQPVFALIQAVKAGTVTGASDDLAAVGETLTKVDDRKQVWNGQTMVDNPNYGSSAGNSALVQMSGDGKVRPVTEETLQFTSGLSVEKLLGTVGGAYAAVQQYFAKGTCQVVQNWFVRGVGLAVGIFAAIGSGGTSMAFTVGVSLGILYAINQVQAALSNAIHGPDLVTAFDDGSTEAIGSALWIGYASIAGTQAAAAGQVPGNTADIVNYQDAVLNQVNTQYAEMEKEDAANNPLDVTNQYSVLGSAARQYGKATNYNSSPVSVMAGIVALATGSTLATTSTASATSDLSAERFEQCADTSYTDMGINADVACNLRYVMLAEDIAKLEKDDAASTVAQWMEDNGYVDKDTTTGLPIGYTPLDTSQAQNAAMQFVTSAVDGVISQFYNTRNYGTGAAAEYGKYLDFCVYRSTPYGEQYTENSAINGVDSGWVTGKKCMEPSGAVSYFRVYTSLLAAQAAEDEERPVSTTSTASGTCPAGSTLAEKIKQGYWDGEYQDAVFCAIDNTTDVSLTPDELQDADIFKANNDILQTNDTGKVVVRQDAAQDMVNLVKKYQETTKKTTFDVTFSYRSHNLQCLMFFYEWSLSSLPQKCSGGTLTQNQAAALSSKMSGSYEMPRSSSDPPDYGLYTSNHESGHAFDASDLGWVNTCASSKYGGETYADNTCYNFSSDNIDKDKSHVSWKGE